MAVFHDHRLELLIVDARVGRDDDVVAVLAAVRERDEQRVRQDLFRVEDDAVAGRAVAEDFAQSDEHVRTHAAPPQRPAVELLCDNGVESDARDVEEEPAVDLAGVDRLAPSAKRDVDRRRRLPRNAELARKAVARTGGDDAERHGCACERRADLVDRSVTAPRDDGRGAGVHCRLREIARMLATLGQVHRARDAGRREVLRQERDTLLRDAAGSAGARKWIDDCDDIGGRHARPDVILVAHAPSEPSMTRMPVRLALLVVCLAATGYAAFLAWSSERQSRLLESSSRHFADTARAASVAVTELRAAQQAYVAAGQGSDFWYARVTALVRDLDDKLAALKSAATQAESITPLETATGALRDFEQMDVRAREFTRTRQLTAAANLVFTDGLELTKKAAGAIESGVNVELSGIDTARDSLRRKQAYALAAAGGIVGLTLLLLLPVGRTHEREESPVAFQPTRRIADLEKETFADLDEIG